MPTEFCQKCKQSHPGRACDYDDHGDCAETIDTTETRTSDGATSVPARSSYTNKSNKG